ncbi:aldo/keto reductase [Streptomyces platensis]|uniref:aldo/keto reductase n=1 Tax=Streptomyces platensis TaxID=58346 RepID=UPI002B1CDB77|nr:aldo/keto reductase [Streptomyces platensis]
MHYRTLGGDQGLGYQRDVSRDAAVRHHRRRADRLAVLDRAGIEGSLRRLGTDRVDLCYAYPEDRRVSLDETVQALAGLVRDGAVGALGAGGHRTWRLAEARHTGTRAWRHSLCGCTPSSVPVSTPPEGADRGLRAGPVGPRTALSVVAGRFGD